MSHTPGPWSVCIGSTDKAMFTPLSIQERNEGRLICSFEDEGYITKNLKSDAHLISAAPDMLAALENLENDNGQTMPPSAWKMVQKAIAKARGEL